MTDEEKAAEITRLKRMVRAREGMIGYKANVAEIRARIAELEAPEPEPEPVDG